MSENMPVVLQEVDHSPAGIVANAIANGQDIEKLERILDLQIKYEENEAKKAYHKAMAAFKANPPEIFKDKTVGFQSKKPGAQKTSYSHASLHNVSSSINTGLSKHGLSAAFKTGQADGKISVTCTITHELGHSESTTLSAGADNTGNKNSIQAVGSTISYLERYTLLALTGLATKDMDDDGAGSEPVEYVTGKDLAHIKGMVKKYVSDEAAFLRVAGAESVDAIPLRNHNKVLAALNKKMVSVKTGAAKDKTTRVPGEEG